MNEKDDDKDDVANEDEEPIEEEQKRFVPEKMNYDDALES